jgi:hypothetical protein
MAASTAKPGSARRMFGDPDPMLGWDVSAALRQYNSTGRKPRNGGWESSPGISSSPDGGAATGSQSGMTAAATGTGASRNFGSRWISAGSAWGGARHPVGQGRVPLAIAEFAKLPNSGYRGSAFANWNGAAESHTSRMAGVSASALVSRKGPLSVPQSEQPMVITGGEY